MNISKDKKKPIYLTGAQAIRKAALVDDLYMMLSIASATGVELPDNDWLAKAEVKRGVLNQFAIDAYNHMLQYGI